MRITSEKFVDLGLPNRIWAIAAINGDYVRLSALHDYLANRFGPRDRVIYLGNYLGQNEYANKAVLNELLAFRSALMARSGVEPQDIVHLRGPAEEAWQRLLRLQFAPNPIDIFDKLVAHGAGTWLKTYDMSTADSRTVARAGTVAITRWTSALRNLQRQTSGHEAFMTSLRRAAIVRYPPAPIFKDDHELEFAQKQSGEKMFFIPAGYNVKNRLEDQGDALWFGGDSYRQSSNMFEFYNISRIVRGCAADSLGVETDNAATTLDANCGMGGPLVCGCFYPDGALAELVAIGGPGINIVNQFDDDLADHLRDQQLENFENQNDRQNDDNVSLNSEFREVVPPITEAVQKYDEVDLVTAGTTQILAATTLPEFAVAQAETETETESALCPELNEQHVKSNVNLSEPAPVIPKPVKKRIIKALSDRTKSEKVLLKKSRQSSQTQQMQETFPF